MATSKKSKPEKKPTQTLRQATANQSVPKKRRLRSSVKGAGKPLGKVKAVVSKPVKKVGRLIIPRYFRNSWRELKEVTWPDARQTAKLTMAVVAFAAVFGVAIAIVDYGLEKIFRALLT